MRSALTLSVLLLLSCCAGLAETLRVASWSMRPADPRSGLEPAPEILQQAATTLRQLNPDVILLQGAKDWKSCNLLAQALQPAQYTVTLCSSFPDPATGQPAARQLSILSRQKPYFFWSEAWRAPEGGKAAPGGFAFIALQRANQRLGLYCVELGDAGASDAAAQQMLAHAQTVKEWEANAVQVTMLGGGFPAPEHRDALPRAVALLQEKGYADACFDLGLERRISEKTGVRERGETTTWLLAEQKAFGVSPQEVSTSGNVFVTCDLELDPAKVAAHWTVRAQELERRSLANRVEQEAQKSATATVLPLPQAPTSRSAVRTWWWVSIPFLTVLAGLLTWRQRARRRPALPRHSTPVLLPGAEGGWSGVSSYTVVISPQSVTGSADNDTPIPSTPHPVVHLETPTVQTQSAGAGCSPRGLIADEATRTRLLADLGRWLKQKLVRSLVADRRQMLEAQQAAALKAKAVDERLARIEQQVQRQTRDYELKIEELSRELVAAKEENRELIRARIAQVKLEMAALRSKAIAQAREDADSAPQP